MQAAARLDKRRGIVLPAGLVEVGGKKEARLVLEQRIDACNEGAMRWLAGRMTAQVPIDDLIGHREKRPVCAIRALDLGLAADAAHPFTGAGGRVSGLARRPALEAARIEIVPATEERSEQCDLRPRGRTQVNVNRLPM
jgi:hypothetical protein